MRPEVLIAINLRVDVLANCECGCLNIIILGLDGCFYTRLLNVEGRTFSINQ